MIPRRTFANCTLWLLAAALLLACLPVAAQAPPPPSPPPPDPIALYQQLRTVGLDPARVYRVRSFAFDREQLHFVLDEGTIALTTAVDGHVTGAFFSGDGEVLLMPPSNVERASLALFTGAAIFEDRFSTAYFRFTDDFLRALEPYLRPADDPAAFLAQWDSSARQLAEGDALRILLRMVNHAGDPVPSQYLHARLGSMHYGIYDVVYDSSAPERISVVQPRSTDQGTFVDIWTSFSGRLARPLPPLEQLSLDNYRIHARIAPPRDVDINVSFDLVTDQPRHRLIALELSRYLKVSSATADGVPLGIIQNPALEGSQLARRGNDILVLVFPQPVPPGRKLRVTLHYSGPVLSEAGGGLMYVGARGTWYPARSIAFANFECDFVYPAGWTLVSTGKRVSQEERDGLIHARFVTEVPIALAGFNLGQYQLTTDKAGTAEVDVYSARAFESSLQPPAPAAPVVLPPTPHTPPPPPLLREPVPSPTENAEEVARPGAAALAWYQQVFGPYPYGSLSFTQMPGRDSQGWPGLIFLSSYAFLPRDSRIVTGGDATFANFLNDYLVAAHETAHQWWGDAVLWRSYHDQWMMEALANYSALMLLERDHPGEVRAALDHYRREMLRENREGVPLRAAGPVTLGLRLASSRFPDGYQMIAYGRGTWLMHMLRCMLRDVADDPAHPDERFLSILRGLIASHRGAAISTEDLQRAFEKDWPARLRYEGSSSLDWFFQGWVNGTAIPRFSLEKVSILRRGGRTFATGRLLQKDAPSRLVTSVPIYAEVAKSKQPVFLARIFADGSETTFRLAAPAGTRKLLVDPFDTVLSQP